ncbi:hypothetical protein [uncultured Rhodoblastus sp.]|uniref:hypothetical protein n=1 Tax=uncultured Rhodoblastus sp. TaxID=543037 RepID=UPI0025D2BF23|nr:hypothetical protein [uncultured Rhodoblastus sp.]
MSFSGDDADEKALAVVEPDFQVVRIADVDVGDLEGFFAFMELAALVRAFLEMIKLSVIEEIADGEAEVARRGFDGHGFGFPVLGMMVSGREQRGDFGGEAFHVGVGAIVEAEEAIACLAVPADKVVSDPLNV